MMNYFFYRINTVSWLVLRILNSVPSRHLQLKTCCLIYCSNHFYFMYKNYYPSPDQGLGEVPFPKRIEGQHRSTISSTQCYRSHDESHLARECHPFIVKTRTTSSSRVSCHELAGMSRKRPLESGKNGEVVVAESIKTLRLHESRQETPQETRQEVRGNGVRSLESQSSLLPPQVDDSQEKADANYGAINPILREAHFLRQLRLAQRSSGSHEHGTSGGNDDMEQ